MKKIFVYMFLALIIGASYIFSQDHSELVNSGIDQYQSGDYNGAVDTFTKAINHSPTTKSDVPLTNVSKETNVNVSEETFTKTSKETGVNVNNESYIEASKENYVGVSGEQNIGATTKNYINDPLEHQGSNDAQLYLYRGRALMQTGDFEGALNDFDKAVELDQSFSEAYFRRALANHKLDSDETCSDLEKAKEKGHESANILYKKLCK